MTNNEELNSTIEETVKQYVDPLAKIIAVEKQHIKLGFQSQDVQRHKVSYQLNNSLSEAYLVTKKAELNERRVLNRLQSQLAAIPFNWTKDIRNNAPSYVCMQDVDHKTDYTKINIDSVQEKIPKALAYIHGTNYRLAQELQWLPLANREYIMRMLEKWWRSQWEKAKKNEEFVENFRAYIPELESVSTSIVDDMENIIKDESSHTLVHTDLHPGNILCSVDNDIFFLDWADAHYGSYYFDIPLRFSHLEEAQIYRDLLAETHNIVIPSPHFNQQFRTASRYLGIRYIAWTFGNWKNSPGTLQALNNYLNMIVN